VRDIFLVFRLMPSTPNTSVYPVAPEDLSAVSLADGTGAALREIDLFVLLLLSLFIA
jgi:hypothetical protein